MSVKTQSKFRATLFGRAIPVALARNPNLATYHEIMVWGRWSSNSYKAYTHLKYEAKLGIFEKIFNIYNL